MPIYVNVDSPNLGNFFGGTSEKKTGGFPYLRDDFIRQYYKEAFAM